MRFEYENLVNLFENALLTELRGHGSGSDFLRSWVPDTDPVKSLINMADAADVEGVDAFEVDVATASLSPASFKELATALKDTFAIKFDASKAQRIVLSFTRTGGQAAQPAAAGSATKKTISWEGDGWKINLAATNGVITETSLQWNNPAADKALIDALAKSLKGMSLREARDHGVQYAYAAKANGGAAPVSGIAIPANYSETSRAAVKALRAAIDASEQPNAADWNFEDHGLSDAWRKIPKDVRTQQLTAMLDDCFGKTGQKDSVIITDIDEHDRVFLQFTDDFPIAQKPSALMQLERYVRKATGERIEFFVSELKDNNRIRRL